MPWRAGLPAVHADLQIGEGIAGRHCRSFGFEAPPVRFQIARDVRYRGITRTKLPILPVGRIEIVIVVAVMTVSSRRLTRGELRWQRPQIRDTFSGPARDSPGRCSALRPRIRHDAVELGGVWFLIKGCFG